jgi:hypothetical protein
VSSGIRATLSLFVLLTTCLAQEGLTIQNKSKEKVPDTEVEKIYVSACTVVRQEFHDGNLINPSVTLVLGGDKDEIVPNEQEIRLVKWDPYLFAQGVVMLTFQDLLPVERKLTMTSRALSQAEATIAVHNLAK